MTQVTTISDFDAGIIRQARELVALTNHAGRRAWLVANGRPEAKDADYGMVNAMITGSMRYYLGVLAAGYERELSRNA